jgi:2-polyprenyl-3-methyl-5-hydroxy-6-metoxy-1,4-benzoquinol methylase
VPSDLIVDRACVICGNRKAAHLFTKEGFELAKCRGCGLVFVTNPPSTDDLERLYSFDHGYHAKYATVEADTTFETTIARDHMAALSRLKPGGRLLDVGCSAGIFLKQARDAGWEVFGIERSPNTAEVARSRFGLDVKTGALTEGIFPAGFFDAVTLWDVVEHLEDPVPVLETIKHILRDDGVLLMETPNIDGLFPRLSYQVAANLNYWPHPEPPGHLFQFSKKTIRRLLQTAGMKTISIEDRRIALFYSFGRLRELLHSPKRLAYAAAFAPFAAVGPALGQGDSVVVAATKA